MGFIWIIRNFQVGEHSEWSWVKYEIAISSPRYSNVSN